MNISFRIESLIFSISPLKNLRLNFFNPGALWVGHRMRLVVLPVKKKERNLPKLYKSRASPQQSLLISHAISHKLSSSLRQSTILLAPAFCSSLFMGLAVNGPSRVPLQICEDQRGDWRGVFGHLVAKVQVTPIPMPTFAQRLI